MNWPFWLALPPLAVACFVDLRWRLIPDWVSLALLLLGAVAVVIAPHPGTALVVGLIGAVVGIVSAGLGLWGWGDAKMFAGVALIVGANGMAPLIVGMALTGALLVLVSLALRPTARRHATISGSTLPRWLRNELRRCRMAPSVPYAIAIAGGFVSSGVF